MTRYRDYPGPQKCRDCYTQMDYCGFTDIDPSEVSKRMLDYHLDKLDKLLGDDLQSKVIH